jgi:hypothetical protein
LQLRKLNDKLLVLQGIARITYIQRLVLQAQQLAIHGQRYKMRAREFTINVPITIKINGDSDPEVDMGDSNDPRKLALNPIMVPPLQQDIELKKAAVGKQSQVIDELTQDEDATDLEY